MMPLTLSPSMPASVFKQERGESVAVIGFNAVLMAVYRVRH